MKQYYFKVPLFLALFTLIFYHSVSAQCTCTNGEPAQTVVHTKSLATSMEETIWSFPQFDIAVGNLVCADVKALVTSHVRIRMENDEIFPASYNISYRRTSTIAGPGLNPTLVHSMTKKYGPYNLAASDGVYFSGPDYIITARDTVLKNKELSQTVTGNLNDFIGTGNVSYIYNIGVKAEITGGGSYLGGPLTVDIINFTLTYSYCPNTILSSNMRDFTVRNNQNTEAVLHWITETEENSNTYEIELSKNNEPYQSVGQLPAQPVASGTPAEYEHKYQLNKADAGKLLFRIKQTDASGKVTYTPVKTLMVSSQTTTGSVNVYPNPVVNRFSLQFSHLLRGDYLVAIADQTGNLVLNRVMRVADTYKLDVALSQQLPPGIYYVRTREQSTGRTYSSKILVNR